MKRTVKLKRQIQQLRKENRKLKKENKQLRKENQRLRVENKKIRQRIEEKDEGFSSHTTYVNFDIAGTRGYIRGYIVTSKQLPISTLKELCIQKLYEVRPRFRISRFIVAKEYGQVSYTRFVLFRENDEIENELINI